MFYRIRKKLRKLLNAKRDAEQDFLYGHRLTAQYFDKQDDMLHDMFLRLSNGERLADVLNGFDGTQFGERIAEYPFLFNWIISNANENSHLLDVGCVVNNTCCRNVLESHIRGLTFCNPALEQLKVKSPLTYHVGTTSSLLKTTTNCQYDLISCLSTIEHIGYDNSQYGSDAPQVYDRPTMEPVFNLLNDLALLLSEGGHYLISVPFGKRDIYKHRVTGKEAFQLFDEPSLQLARTHASTLNLKADLKFFAGSETGWHEVDNPQEFDKPYARGFPGAAGVAFLTGSKHS